MFSVLNNLLGYIFLQVSLQYNHKCNAIVIHMHVVSVIWFCHLLYKYRLSTARIYLFPFINAILCLLCTQRFYREDYSADPLLSTSQ